MTLNAGAAGDDDDLAGMEQLRARFAARGVAAKPGGRLRKSASVAAVSAVTSLAYERTAVESVHGGLVVSLDADCRAYRSEITALTKRCAELEEQAKPASELHQQLKTMGDELRLLRSQASDANRMRETLQTTVADLKQRLAEQQQQQQQQSASSSESAGLERDLADARAERDALAGRMGDLTSRLDAETTTARAAVQGAEAAEKAHTQATGRLEARLAESEAKRALLVEGEAAQQEALDAARKLEAELSAKLAAAAESAKAQLERAHAEAAEARGERDAYARRLGSLGEKADEKGKKLGEQAAGLKSENGRLADLVKSLKAKVQQGEGQAEEARQREQEAAKAQSKRLERRVKELEGAQADLQAEVLCWRTTAEEARAEADAARARAEHLGQQQQTSALPPTVLGPVDDPRAGSAFGKHVKTVQAQQAEIAQLKEQVDHLSFLLSASSSSPGRSALSCSAATSPMKPPRAPRAPQLAAGAPTATEPLVRAAPPSAVPPAAGEADLS